MYQTDSFHFKVAMKDKRLRIKAKKEEEKKNILACAHVI